MLLKWHKEAIFTIIIVALIKILHYLVIQVIVSFLKRHTKSYWSRNFKVLWRLRPATNNELTLFYIRNDIFATQQKFSRLFLAAVVISPKA